MRINVPLARCLTFMLMFHCFILFNIKQGHHSTELVKFAYGSCFMGFLQSDRLDIFNTIMKTNPQLWLWLGDVAYLDYPTANYFKNTIALDEEEFRKRFETSKNEPYYTILRKAIPTIGTYDDHDYGFNDANKHFPHKDVTKRLFLDFLDEPSDSELRQANRGIYSTYSFGDTSTHKTVRFIILDTRYEKTSNVDKEPDMLGDLQWQWLENTLKNANETLIFLVSGTQILPSDRMLTEAWYTNSRERLFNLIGKYKKSGIIFLTGDVHFAEINRTFCVLPEIGYHLHEITSSGLTHHQFQGTEFIFDWILGNRYRQIPIINDINFAKIDIKWGNSLEEVKVMFNIIDYSSFTRAKFAIGYPDLVFSKAKSEATDPKCMDKTLSRFMFLYPDDVFAYYYKSPILILYFIPIIGFIYGLYRLLKLIVCCFAGIFMMNFWFLRGGYGGTDGSNKKKN